MFSFFSVSVGEINALERLENLVAGTSIVVISRAGKNGHALWKTSYIQAELMW